MADRRSWGVAAVLTLALGLWGVTRATRPPPVELPADAPVLPDRLLPHCLYGLDPHANGVMVRLRGEPGYRLRLGPFDLRAWMGFQNGDTLLAVNGHTLGGPEDWFEARKVVEGVRECDWTVVRGGAELHLYARRSGGALDTGDFDRTDVLALLIDPYLDDHWRGSRHRGVEEVLRRAGAPPEARYVRGDTPADRRRSGLRRYLMESLLSEPGALVVVEAGEGEGHRSLQIVWTGAEPPRPVTPLEESGYLRDEFPPGPSVPRRDPEPRPPPRTDFDVPRSEVKGWFADPGALAQTGRAIPHRDAAGEIDGFRISGIRRGSIPEGLGLRNGDVVHAVNGKPLVGMEAASQALSVLQSADRVVVDLSRRGEPLRLTYRFVDP
jgi:hypothetical protein